MAETLNGATWNEGRILGWKPLLVFLFGTLAALVLLYFETASSMVAQWMGNDTYAHGFLIAPISLWLIWEKRTVLMACVPQPSLRPVFFMVPLGAAWLLAELVDVLVVQQYAFVGLLILVIWAMLGTPVARYLAFPIGFLFFMVPVGEGLVPPMMNFTADFTVGMLRLTGIPVYRDGTFFSIPSGDWSVVTACSGIRYLLASVTLGVLYAYLTYSKLWKRLLFTAISILVPIIANGLRAYMIVMIGHLSDMKLATGVDHLFYGWVFFGIVIAIMFAVGAFWRDPPKVDATVERSSRVVRSPTTVALTAIAVAAVWAGLAWSVSWSMQDASGKVQLRAPQGAGQWHLEPGSRWSWRPHVEGTDGSMFRFYSSDHGIVSLYVGVYRTQRQGAELINFANRMIPEKHPEWVEKEATTRGIEPTTGAMSVNQGRLASRRGEHLLVWSWYRVGTVQTNNPVVAKLAEAGYGLVSGRRDGALIAVAASMTTNQDAAAKLLSDFISSMLPTVEQEIDRSVSDTGP